MKTLVNTLLLTDTKKRPRVHEILAMPIIKGRIKEFLTTTIANIEFNHTVIHKKDLYQIHNEQKDNNNKGNNLRSNSRASIDSGEDKKSVKSNSRPNLSIADENKEEKDKAKAEELAKKQRLIQEEKEKEKIKRDQEKTERARKEQERAKLREKEIREKELREKEQQKLRDLKNSAQRDNSRPNTPSYNLKNNENVKYVSNPKIKLESPRLASPSIQLKSPKPRLQSPSPRLKSPSPKLPNIKQRPLSSRNQDNVKGFNIQDQVNNHISNNSNGIPKYENNVYDCRPSSKLAAQKD